MKTAIAFFLILSCTILSAQKKVPSKKLKLEASLDCFVNLPGAYSKTTADLEKDFPKEKFNRNPYFQWLRKDKTRVIFKRNPSPNLNVDLTVLDGKVRIEEAVVDYRDGKFIGITISVFNRGDGGQISGEEFKNRFTALGKHLGVQLDTHPRKRIGNVKKGVMTTGFSWTSPRGMAVLLCNPDVGEPTKHIQKTEFMRMRLARRDAKGIYQAALQERSLATVRKSELPRKVVKKDGNIFIDNIPMVDQGNKGYCVVASAQRLFEHYGIECDMHQLAQLAKADPDKGTSPLYINQQLGGIDYLFKTRFTCLAVRQGSRLVELKDEKYVGDTVKRRSYDKFIESNIEDGIPLLWSMQIGKAKEEPAISPQASGGHMRMIIGYNKDKNRIIFTDSWGAGHEFKTMDADDAYRVTQGLYLMKPTVN